MPNHNITVCILALNAEDQIKGLLDSICDWTQEIVVIVDDLSIDKTAEMAKLYTNKVYLKPHQDNFHLNKQAAIELATKEWILWLDVDENISKELKNEILETLENPQADGYLIPRQNFIFGKWIKHTGWYPDYQLRLFKREMGYFPATSIHEQPQLEGKISQLKAVLKHENYKDISQFIEKLNRYTTQDSRKEKNNRQAWSAKDLVNRPIDEFVKRFLNLEGFKDGYHGLTLSLLQAMYEMVVTAKIAEADGFEKHNRENLIDVVEKQMRQGFKIWKWWKREKQIQEASMVFTKIWLRGLRKLGL